MKYHVPTVEAIISHWSVFFPPMYIGCAPIGPIGLIGIAGIVGFWCGEGDLGRFLGAVVAGLCFLRVFWGGFGDFVGEKFCHIGKSYYFCNRK